MQRPVVPSSSIRNPGVDPETGRRRNRILAFCGMRGPQVQHFSAVLPVTGRENRDRAFPLELREDNGDQRTARSGRIAEQITD